MSRKISVSARACAAAIVVVGLIGVAVRVAHPAVAAVGPIVEDVTPGVGRPGQTITFHLRGTGFTASTVVGFGPGTTVRATTLVSASALDVSVEFAANASKGTRDVTVQDPPGAPSMITDAIVVRTPTGEYHPITPARLLDTRNDPKGAVGADEVRLLTVTGQFGIPAANVAGVVVNVTATEPTAASFVTVYPAGNDRPEVSNLNVERNTTVPNLVTVAVGATGQIALYNHAGRVHLVVDAAGWYGTTAADPGAAFVPDTPTRLLDTRIDSGGQPVGTDQVIKLKIATAGSAVGAALNITVTEPTDDTYVTVWPTGAERPVASNLNAIANETVPNMVITALGADGSVNIYNHAGRAHIVVDLLGKYSSDAIGVLGGQFEGTLPVRVLDTRGNVGGFGGRGLGASSSITVAVGGHNGVPAKASAVVMNVTATEPTATGYVTVWPSDAERPTASNLNVVPGQTVPNLVVVPLSSDGTVDVFNQAGATHIIFDVVGWFR